MNIHLPEPISARLANLRRERRLTLGEAARRAGLAYPRLHHLERAARTATLPELTSLAKAYGVELTALVAGSDWTSERPKNRSTEALARLSYASPRGAAAPTVFAKHLASAWKLNPAGVLRLWRRLQSRPDSIVVAIFLRDLWVDSGVEAYFWLQLAAAGGVPVMLPLLQLGLRSHDVLCTKTDLSVGDVSHPALYLPDPWPMAVFSQVRLRTRERTARVDNLFCLGHGNWAAGEVDGGGHNDRWDPLRDGTLTIPVWRWNTSEVQAVDLVQKIRQRAEATFAGLNVAA